MSHNENIGSGWDCMLFALIKCIKSKNSLILDGCLELEAMQKILIIPELRQLTSNWISQLDESNNVSLETSNDYRTNGNQLFNDVNCNEMECVNCYTKAIFAAPKGNEVLGMAHANRAAALMKLEYYKEAHSDCKCARLTNYPKSKLFKVLYRQACCSIQLEDLKQLEKDLKEIDNLLDELKIRHLHSDSLKKLSIQHEELKEKLKSTDKSSNSSCESVCAAEKKLTDKQTVLNGRFSIALEPISPDELIVKEKAFAFIPVYQSFDPDPIDVHCQNCAATNIIPFPCVDCKRASYCGPSCFNEHKEIHQFECSGYKKHLWYEIGIAHLAVRTMLCGIDELMERLSHVRDTTSLAAWNEMLSIVDETDFPYGRVLKLVTNFETSDKDDFLGYILTATMATMYLRNNTHFFKEMTKKYPKFMTDSKWEQFIGAIIARHIGQL
ncbi:SET and MYND domain-containing protein 4, partial [Pseudolycoriella hygida]